jgi:hypothetical protein
MADADVAAFVVDDEKALLHYSLGTGWGRRGNRAAIRSGRCAILANLL